MRRILVIALVLAAGAGLAVFATGASNPTKSASYTVQLDNAFGLIEGADLKVAGVRAGKIKSMKVDAENKKALIGVEITKTGFGSLRKDVFCESRPQSLIGEYFIDCLPGTSKEEFPKGGTIPVSRTASTVAPDLVNDILRLPYRERLRIIINELGVGVAGRAEDLNAAVRRGSPALRETDRVLKILADQNRILRDLVENGDIVIGELARNKEDIGRWVISAGRTASLSAERKVELAQTFHNLPDFLEELRPTMASLGRAADEQTPALRDLSAAARELKRFFDNLGPFSDASRPATRSLGDASVTGKEAVTAAGPTVAQLKAFAAGTPELGKNLAIVLEHLDDPSFAVEDNPVSPGGRGFSGLEALLAYVFDQSLSINVFDNNFYMLKVQPFVSEVCGPYANADRLNDPAEGPVINAQCSAALGPNQPGLFGQFDPSASGPARSRKRSGQQRRAASTPESRAPSSEPESKGDEKPGDSKPDKPKPKIDLPETLKELLPDLPSVPGLPPGGGLPDVPGGLPGLGGGLPGLGGGSRSSARSSGSRSSRARARATISRTQLLDYLLAP